MHELPEQIEQHPKCGQTESQKSFEQIKHHLECEQHRECGQTESQESFEQVECRFQVERIEQKPFVASRLQLEFSLPSEPRV
jgi:hypothetical protein